jgi:hypothetical protein
MPKMLSRVQRIAWMEEMELMVRSQSWFPGSYNSSAPTFLKNQVPMGKYLEGQSGPEIPRQCNCWEAVMASSIKANIYTREQVKYVLSCGNPKTPAARTRLFAYMKESPDIKVDHEAVIPYTRIQVCSLLMFGVDGSHFALAGAYGAVLHLDRGDKGKTTLDEMRSGTGEKGGYKGASYWPLYIKNPPNIPGDIDLLGFG